jgi:hypothetical protein
MQFVYLGDCLDLIASMTDASAQLIVLASSQHRREIRN